MSNLKMIDLCSGIGGCHLAGSRAGFRTVFAADIDEQARAVYERNLGLRPAGDLAGIDPTDVPSHDLLAASTPCQPWSAAGDLGGLDDARSHVLIHVLRILAQKRPAALMCENVAPLSTADGGRALRFLVECLRGCGYRVSWRVLRASEFRGAQLRERLFVIGSRSRRFDFDGVETTGPGRIADFLDPKVDDGWLRPDQYVLLPRPRVNRSGLAFAGYMFGRKRHPGGDPSVQQTHDGYRQIYDASGLGQTITTKTNTRYLVLVDGKVRRITPDEVRRLMGFPAWFRLGPLVEQAHRQLGNSVYVPCVVAILRAVASQLFGVRAEPSTVPAHYDALIAPEWRPDMNDDIVIDPEISSLLAPHTPQELGLLEASLLAEGCREPLAAWRGILLDGHARLDICRRHGLPFRVADVDLSDRDEAVRWVLANQLARRNLRPVAAAYFRGVLYRMAAKTPGARNDLSSGQAARRWASEDIARRFGVDERTVRRDARLADDLDAVAASLGDGFRRAVLSGQARLSRKDIRDLAAMSDAERRRADLGRGRKRSRPKPPPAPVLDLAARLADLWRVAGREERLAFIRMVDIEEILNELMADA